MAEHRYRIIYRSFNRLTKRMHRHQASATGTSRWSAIRAWWQIERQWQNPSVQVLEVHLDHTGCPQAQYSTHWAYTCPLA